MKDHECSSCTGRRSRHVAHPDDLPAAGVAKTLLSVHRHAENYSCQAQGLADSVLCRAKQSSQTHHYVSVYTTIAAACIYLFEVGPSARDKDREPLPAARAQELVLATRTPPYSTQTRTKAVLSWSLTVGSHSSACIGPTATGATSHNQAAKQSILVDQKRFAHRYLRTPIRSSVVC